NIAGLVGISFSWQQGEGWYISVPDDEAGAKEILSDLNKVFLSGALKVGQNIKYDLLVLYRYGIKPKPPFFDTMVAHYLIEPSAMRRNLQALSQNHLKYDPVSYADMLEGKSDIREVPIERIKEYACEDADITLQLKEVLEPKLTESGNATLFKQIEAPLIPVLAAMEAEGIRIDREVLATQSGELSTEADQVQKRIFEDVGFEFNISSPKQVGEVLFEHLKIIDKPRKTRTGQYATGEDILLRLKHSHPVVEYILEYREILKLKNTYVDTFPSMINPHTGRIHTSFNQVVTSTGRLSSDKPNLQNIPIRSERGRRIRKAFVPRNDDYCLMSADYSQIELRVIASISKDEGMMTAFNEGLDIHAATAAKIFSVPLEDVTAEMRRKAKAVNFGIAYGQTAFGLSQSLQIPKSEAAEIIDSFFRQFPGVKLYMESVVRLAREKGFVQTLKGRRHYLKDINSLNANVRNHAERIAINSPIQGSAADMIKIAMIGIYDELNKRKLFSNLLLQVHDELVLDVHNTEIEEVKELVNQCMKTALPLEVPVIADINTGKNWLDAH
ncbi:MAG: DNA polymerase I, partial [Flavobacteriales bacterium]